MAHTDVEEVLLSGTSNNAVRSWKRGTCHRQQFGNVCIAQGHKTVYEVAQDKTNPTLSLMFINTIKYDSI